MIKVLLLTGALALLLGACRQEDENPPDQTTLLTTPRWELATYEYRFEATDTVFDCLALTYERSDGEMRVSRGCPPNTQLTTVPNYGLLLRFRVDAANQGIYQVKESVAGVNGNLRFCEENEAGTWFYGLAEDVVDLTVTNGGSRWVSDLFVGGNLRADTVSLRQFTQSYRVTMLTADQLVLVASDTTVWGRYNIRAAFANTAVDLCE